MRTKNLSFHLSKTLSSTQSKIEIVSSLMNWFTGGGGAMAAKIINDKMLEVSTDCLVYCQKWDVSIY